MKPDPKELERINAEHVNKLDTGQTSLQAIRKQFANAFKDEYKLGNETKIENCGGSEICSLCNVTKKLFDYSIRNPQAFKERKYLKTYFGLKVIYIIYLILMKQKNSITFCLLHMVERLGTNLLYRTLKNKDNAMKWFITYFKSMNKTKFKARAQQLGISLPEKDVSYGPFDLALKVVDTGTDVGEFADIEFNMIPEKWVRGIVYTSPIWLKDLMEEMGDNFLTKKEIDLWNIFKRVFPILTSIFILVGC